MDKSLKKHIPGAIIFLLLLFLVLRGTFTVLWLRDDSFSAEMFRQYYDLPENSVDAIYIGSSGVREHYIAPVGFHNTGVAVYPLATSNQPITAARFVIEEALKTQEPQLILIDIRDCAYENTREGAIRKMTDSMHFFSKTRYDMIDALLPIYQELEPEAKIRKWDYYFSYTTYHNRWKELTQDDFIDPPVWLGYSIFDHTEPVAVPEEKEIAPMDLPGHNEEALQDLLEYCRTLDAKVVFTRSLGVYPESADAMILTAAQMIEEAGFEVLNFEGMDVINAIGVDLEHDMKNEDHLNVYGALKFSDYLSGILASQYGLPDHRGDHDYAFWLEEYTDFMGTLLEITEDEYQKAAILPRYVP